MIECAATVDLSNVNLLDFKYFKPEPSSGHHSLSSLSKAKLSSHQNIKETLVQSILTPITDKFQKVKSVGTYFKNVLLGNPEHKTIRIIKFDPHFGEAWQPYYEHYYGPKGKYLIESLGQGYNPTVHNKNQHYYDIIDYHYYDHHYNQHHHGHYDHHNNYHEHY